MIFFLWFLAGFDKDPGVLNETGPNGSGSETLFITIYMKYENTNKTKEV